MSVHRKYSLSLSDNTTTSIIFYLPCKVRFRITTNWYICINANWHIYGNICTQHDIADSVLICITSNYLSRTLQRTTSPIKDKPGVSSLFSSLIKSKFAVSSCISRHENTIHGKTDILMMHAAGKFELI